MLHKYLTDAGVPENDMPWNWNPNDDRQEKWKEQKEKYGFDEKETWSLDYTFRLWFYERLKMYNELNIVDTSFHKFAYKDKIYTQQECIDFILNTFEETFKNDNWDFNKEILIKVNKSYELIALILPTLWW